jgi:hypothetical protein
MVRREVRVGDQREVKGREVEVAEERKREQRQTS